MLRAGHVEIPAENEKRRVSRRIGWPPVALASRRRTTPYAASVLVARQQEGELVAADAEGAIGGRARWRRSAGRAWRAAGRRRHGHRCRSRASGRRGRSSRARADSPRRMAIGDLAGQLLLEGAMVAEPGERIDARIEGCPIVGRARVAEVLLEARAEGLDVAARRDAPRRRRSRSRQPLPRRWRQRGRRRHRRRPRRGRPRRSLRRTRIRARGAAARSRPCRARPACPWQGPLKPTVAGRHPYPEVPPTAPDRRRGARRPEAVYPTSMSACEARAMSRA